MKYLSKITFAFFAITILFSRCEKDDKEVLKIENVLAENHNGGTEVPLGATISIEFDAIAGESARLDFYHVEIHDHPASGEVSDEYKIIDDSFKDDETFKGLRNSHKHVHVPVPDTANLGSYHVVIVVVDEDGNSVDTEGLETHITIVE